MPIQNAAYAAQSATSGLHPWTYEIRDPLEDEILMEVFYCGLCHTDIHQSRNEWGLSTFPQVPGHEFVGRVKQAGSAVKKFKVGDNVGIGCFVGSCRNCEHCAEDHENMCKGAVDTYAGEARGERTFGGYGRYVVCREDFVISIPDGYPLDKAAPLLCAGITTYSPIIYNKMERGGLKIGVLGLGGLGHLSVLFAKAMGNEVYVFSRSDAKAKLAAELGASGLIYTKEGMAEHEGTFHYILDTLPVEKPMEVYMNLLRPYGGMIMMGLPSQETKMQLPYNELIRGNKFIQGSLIGGIADTQRMVNFCAEKKIYPMIELIACNYVNEAFERAEAGKVQFRFVFDVRNTGVRLPTDAANPGTDAGNPGLPAAPHTVSPTDVPSDAS